MIFETTFRTKIVVITENIDLAKLSYKNNFQKLWKPTTAYFDRTWHVSNGKRIESASQNIHIKKESDPIYYIQNVY